MVKPLLYYLILLGTLLRPQKGPVGVPGPCFENQRNTFSTWTKVQTRQHILYLLSFPRVVPTSPSCLSHRSHLGNNNKVIIRCKSYWIVLYKILESMHFTKQNNYILQESALLFYRLPNKDHFVKLNVLLELWNVCLAQEWTFVVSFDKYCF